jgi:hypothetical protein
MRAIGLCCRTTDSLGYEYKKGLQLIADPFLDTSPSLRWGDVPSLGDVHPAGVHLFSPSTK